MRGVHPSSPRGSPIVARKEIAMLRQLCTQARPRLLLHSIKMQVRNYACNPIHLSMRAICKDLNLLVTLTIGSLVSGDVLFVPRVRKYALDLTDKTRLFPMEINSLACKCHGMADYRARQSLFLGRTKHCQKKKNCPLSRNTKYITFRCIYRLTAAK